MQNKPNPNPVDDYQQWRDWKLSITPNYCRLDPCGLFVTIEDASTPTKSEVSTLLDACRQHNFALYRFKNPAQSNKENVHNLARLCGLHTLDSNICADEDSLTSITQTHHVGQHNYIPYSNRQLSWHTDGYYNPPGNQINGMLLHCVTAASEGGISRLMDPDIAFILLKEKNPAWVESLMQQDVLTIPANELNGQIIRAAQSGPVFSFNAAGRLHMRYSARKRNIEWKQETPILDAVAFLETLWDQAANNSQPHILNHTLQAGEGLVCNNVLHCRTAFVDNEAPGQKRLLYRGRYYNSVAEPGDL